MVVKESLHVRHLSNLYKASLPIGIKKDTNVNYQTSCSFRLSL